MTSCNSGTMPVMLDDMRAVFEKLKQQYEVVPPPLAPSFRLVSSRHLTKTITRVKRWHRTNRPDKIRVRDITTPDPQVYLLTEVCYITGRIGKVLVGHPATIAKLKDQPIGDR